MEYHPTHAIHLPLEDFSKLEFHLMDTRPGVKPDAFVKEMIRHWLMIDTERCELRTNGRPMRGYQWKNVFLPDGTYLRTSFHDTTEYAKVVGEYIRTDSGDVLTPSMFANGHAQGRNAWRCVWLRFPGDGHWIRASDCRSRADAQARHRAGTLAGRPDQSKT